MIPYRTTWKIEKRDAQGQLLEIAAIEGNLLLTSGLSFMLQSANGEGTLTPFNAASAYIGVGDSTTAESATQTGLQAATNKAYAAMDTGYPTAVTNGASTYQAVFDGDTANFAWNEFCLVNSATGADVALNRKVSAQGTKASGQVWTVTMTINLGA